MNSQSLRTLRICRPMIVQSLDPIEILDYLIAEGHFNLDESERICAQQTAQSKSRMFLDLLFRKSNSSFKCFLEALSGKYDFLATAIKSEYEKVSVQRERQGSLTDIHRTLLHGAVPDRPVNYLERPLLLEMLTCGLKWLASQFAIQSSAQRANAPTLDSLKQYQVEFDPPTNAWLLVHGMAGQGKSVLTASTLRQNHALLAEHFSGGVIWLRAGIPSSNDPSFHDDQIISLLSQLNEHVEDALLHPTEPLDEDMPVFIRQNLSHQRFDLRLIKALLKRKLISRQYRKSENLDPGNNSPPYLILIVLDDVWNEKLITTLADLPAAFLVTSRDSNILQRVSGPVRKELVKCDLTDPESAQLISATAGMPIDYFKPGSPFADLPGLCRGSPLASVLVGFVLASPPHSISQFLVTKKQSNYRAPFIDWTRIYHPSNYTYSSVHEAILPSLSYLPLETLRCYESFVIFEDDCPQTAEMFSIFWSCSIQEATTYLQQLTNLSLVDCTYKMETARYVYCVNNLQVDLLRVSVPLERQMAYHREFVANYVKRFGEQWTHLADSPIDHTHFCQSLGEHLLKIGSSFELIDLLVNLQLICARILILGPSAVVADFRRYRPVFEVSGRMSDWHTYLRFLQTTAYHLINPDSSVRALHMRARSPTRPGSLVDVTLSGISQITHRSMTPDEVLQLPQGRPSSLVFRSPTRRENDTLDRRCCSPNRLHSYGSFRLTKNSLLVKGLDLVQLGLTLPQNNAVFKQCTSIIVNNVSQMKSQFSPKYYWFWSNSNTAGSELLWATRTGTVSITTISQGPNASFLQTSLRVYGRIFDDRSINRHLIGTSDGRIIILDATSGYEVAVHQVHREAAEVKAICLLPGGRECLSLGSDGSMIVSTLPPLDQCPRSPTTPLNRSDNGPCSASPAEQFFDTIDVDEQETPTSDDGTPYDVSSYNNLEIDINMLNENNSNQFSQPFSPTPHQRSSSPVLQENAFPTYTNAPTVLADLPSLVEICRISDSSPTDRKRLADSRSKTTASQRAQKCIALSSLGTCMLFVTSSKSAYNEDKKLQPPIEISMYNVLSGFPEQPPAAHKSSSKFTLLKCRDLMIPTQLTPTHDSSPPHYQPAVVRAIFSPDDSLIACCLSNGRIWIYSLDEIGWVACISSALSTKADPITTAPASIRTPRPSTEMTPLQQPFDSEILNYALVDGPVSNACSFLSWPISARLVSSSGLWSPPLTPLLSASIGHFVYVWSIKNELPTNVSNLQTESALMVSSRAQFRLPCPPGVFAYSLDTQPIGNHCLLAAGMTNGRSTIWSLPELCKIFDVCAHPSRVTGVRLFPHSFSRDVPSDGDTRSSDTLFTFATASSDGVVKAWQLEWTSIKGQHSLVSSLPVSESTSPAHQSIISRRIETCQKMQPYPLWAELFDVFFGKFGDFYAIGRIKSSCSLQLLYRDPDAFVDSEVESASSLKCIELDVSSTHPFGQRRRQLHNHLIDSNHVSSKFIVPSTAAFSSDISLLAIGYENGFIDVVQLKSPNSQLPGFTRVCVLSTETIVNQNGSPRHAPSLLLPSARKILHLSILSPSSNSSDSPEFILTAITANATVHAWVINSLSELCDEDDEIITPLMHPRKSWLRLHMTSIINNGFHNQHDSFLDCSISSRHISMAPVVWFNTYYDLVPLRSLCSANSTFVNRVSWLSAGKDGFVYGRNLSFSTRETEWSFDLNAHAPFEITDADLDPTGAYLATSSVDQTVKVWCLCTSQPLFVAPHRPSSVRCVKFRPVAEFTRLGAELFIASGDDSGTLRIWRITFTSGSARPSAWPNPDFMSTAPSCGGSWLFRLSWSADGGILSGLSDRLCVWPFVRSDFPPHRGSVVVGKSPLPLPSKNSSDMSFKLCRCRVLHVFDTLSTGDSAGCPFRQRLSVGTEAFCDGARSIPPPIITLDSSSGVLFVFDPIEAFSLRYKP